MLATQKYLDALSNLAEREGFLALYSLERRKPVWVREPVEIPDVFERLAYDGVPQDELDALRRIPAPRPPRTPKRDDYGVYEFSRDIGVSVAEAHGLSEKPEYAKFLRIYAKAIKGLPALAGKVFARAVRKVVVTTARGTENARWDPGGTLVLCYGDEPEPGVFRYRLVHEMGHALEELCHLTVTPWSSVYGNPPYVSAYAGMNATEDFAEVFAHYVVDPSHLKKTAPEKYVDMASRIKSANL